MHQRARQTDRETGGHRRKEAGTELKFHGTNLRAGGGNILRHVWVHVKDLNVIEPVGFRLQLILVFTNTSYFVTFDSVENIQNIHMVMCIL